MNAICCETGRKLGAQFAEAARLYAEAVVVFTSNHANVSWDEYIRLRAAVEEAQRRSEALGIAYEEHVESHRRRGETFFSRTEPSEATLTGRTGSDRDR
jgi:hypothetical protein